MKYVNVNLIAAFLLTFTSVICIAQNDDKITGADTSQILPDPNMELMLASIEGDTAKVLEWIEKGADVNCKSSYEGVTPLMYAAQNGHLETVRILLHHGANENALPVESCQRIAWCLHGWTYVYCRYPYPERSQC